MTNEETRQICPNCKSASVGPGESVCANCKKAKPKMPTKMREMGAGGVTGFQLPIGAVQRRESLDRCVKENRDVKEGHVLVFLRGAGEDRLQEFYDALDFQQFGTAADMIREHVIREVVRKKITEVVRKKAGGGGYVLYAPNKGKKKNSKPVGTFPTRLAAKRAELARFPPKDPDKLQRLRKSVDRMMKDPKKRDKAEDQARKPKPSTGKHKFHVRKARKAKHFESKIISKIVVNEVKSRLLGEGLFREDAPPSEWDEYMNKLSDRVKKGDKGFQRIMGKVDQATQGALGKAVKEVQKQLGARGRVKLGKSKKTDDGRSYLSFNVIIDDGEVGPIYAYVHGNSTQLEMSDNAKASLSKITPEGAKALRAALHSMTEISEAGDLAGAVGQRDAYLSKLESGVDRMISNLSPLQMSMLKRLLVKKYRGMDK